MITHDKFDWNLTNKYKICIFIPNYQRGKYIDIALTHFFENNFSSGKWCVLIGNDSSDAYADSLVDKFPDTYSFTINRQEGNRNGGFIRNVAIKNIKSPWILQKDPEIILAHKVKFDWLNDLELLSGNFYRADYIKMLSIDETNSLVNGINIDNIEKIDSTKHYHIHHCLLTETKALRNICGYREIFSYYGPEDHDLYRRLLLSANQITIDNLISLHMYHARPFMDDQRHFQMVRLFEQLDPNEIIANKDMEWGNG